MDEDDINFGLSELARLTGRDVDLINMLNAPMQLYGEKHSAAVRLESKGICAMRYEAGDLLTELTDHGLRLRILLRDAATLIVSAWRQENFG